jgi:hypothetical protein
MSAPRSTRCSRCPPWSCRHILTPEDIEMFRNLQLGIEFLGEEVIVQFMRVLGAAVERVAEALTDAYTTRSAGGFSLKGFAEEVHLYGLTRSG